MKIVRNAFLAAAVMGLVACSGDDEEMEDPMSTDLGSAIETPSLGDIGSPADAMAEAVNTAAADAAEAAAPAAQPAANSMYVQAYYLNVRATPERRNNRVGVLRRGDRVQVFGHHGRWVKIGEGRWVSGRYLRNYPYGNHTH